MAIEYDPSRRAFIRQISLASLEVAGALTVIPGCKAVYDSEKEKPRIHLDTFPTVLPNPVQESSLSAVDIASRNVLLSGVVIEPGLVLSAGHGWTEKNPSDNCYAGGIYISGRRENGTVTGGKLARVFSSQSPDVALIQTILPIDLPAAKIRDNQEITWDDKLFFVNYQPDEDKKDRNPSKNKDGYGYPAIIGGKAIGKDKDGLIAVVTTKSYGEIPDDETRPGASGGPIFDKDGYLIGIHKRSHSLPRATIEKTYDVALQGASDRGILRVSYIVPTTRTLIENAKQNLIRNMNECVPKN